MSKRSDIWTEFNDDVEQHGGYLYTSDKLSCRLANGRISRAVEDLVNVAGRDVIDIGCGDGTYSMELARAGARRVLGVDAAAMAIERARQRAAGNDQVEFEVGDATRLHERGERFDVAIIRGLLHHVDDPAAVAASACKVANDIVIVEPNGYNPVLKVIERVSPYHVRHDEKSFRATTIDGWFRRGGGQVERATFIGLVPYFCPDPMAKVCKRVEPLIERLAPAARLFCGQYVARFRGRPGAKHSKIERSNTV